MSHRKISSWQQALRRRTRPVARPLTLFPLIAVLALALIWATTFSIIRVNDRAAAHAAAASTSVLLSAYEAQVVRNLREIDLTLNLVRYWHQRTNGRTLADLRQNGLLPPDLLFDVSIADSTGVIVESTRPSTERRTLDPATYRKPGGDDDLMVGQLPSGPTDGKQLPFSRRLNASSGAFDGFVIVSVDAAYFVSGYDVSKLGKHGVLALIGAAGQSQVRRTGDTLISGGTIDYAAALQDPDATEVDTQILTSPWDGTPRWTGAREIYGFPLAVLIGLSVDEQMAPAHAQARAYLWWAAFASMVVIALSALLGRMSWHLEQRREMFRLMAESTSANPFTLNLARNCFTYIGAQAIADSGIPESQWKIPGGLDVVVPRKANAEVRRCFDECQVGFFEFITPLRHGNAGLTEVRWTGTCEMVNGAKYLRGLMLDVTELRRLGRELAAAQKLESVGRMAAGVAHEINTPVQFVSDNVQFVRSSMNDVAGVVAAYRDLIRAVQSEGDLAAATRRVDDAETAADFGYIMENVPAGLESAAEGLERIATIVRSMKEFAHPDQADKASADLNHAIRSTLVIAQNEYKYVAEVETDFGDIPPVYCYLGEINQVVLNLLINAAHAIADVVGDSGTLGRLTVRTRLVADEVEIAIGDTGTGILEEAREKIFDPFFTTKEVGKGTGQGLAIAHSVIVKKHGGSLRFETECGVGTTFFVRLPVGEPRVDIRLLQVAA